MKDMQEKKNLLTKIWGSTLIGIKLEHLQMSIAIGLRWEEDGVPLHATLQFSGVRDFHFSANSLFVNEVVELVSIEVEEGAGEHHLWGELSNYEFSIWCASFEVNVLPG